jgi:arylsulfatase A-like enzyme
MDHVADKGVAENTLILFVGDNGSDGPLGDTYGYFSSAPLRGKKGTCYEGGMRVPFIASWAKAAKNNPFKIARNHLHHEQIGTVMDIYSTIVDASNSSSPAKHPVDGVSLLPQLSGKNNKERPDHFMCHFPHSHRSSYFTSFRKGDWKLIYRYLTSGGKRKSKDPLPKHELYNFKSDPYETKNLALKNSKKTNEMIRLMTKQLEDENALFPVRDDLELRPELIK